MSFSIPWLSLFGGMLLGVSALLLLLINGKIAGISGITNGLFGSDKSDKGWRALFLSGMVIAGAISVYWLGVEIPSQPNGSWLMVVAAGLLVGAGTRIGNGCTSGHGICGMGRFSVRSIVATCTFMATAIITVFVRFHLGGA
ncbi:YeeE/YedE family protein [Vibrio astriarenae]|uniref:YeeE/YedE thiosulfate transporter family protein n=1 Tax=Vibrio agarivorans TaxID=153622 RepID=A0ABT7Y3K3_9VIBR|nr:YeeE/YedE thiosulfate transporter family protein [Vibrio agarivorans]MDN2482619.1 YeeE/YedE thiosulfate transporter family protein [Vibrio agarivorans]